VSSGVNDRNEVEPLIETVQLRTHFRTARGIARAVDGVTLQIRRGQSLGVVGESGSGKTVLSRSMMGLLPRNGVIREGSVRYSGEEIGNRTPKQMRSIWGREMAMVFQDPMTSLNPVMKVGKQVTESLRLNLGMSSSEAMDVAEKIFRDVRIPEPTRRLNQYPHELSGGMRQRVMIAIALACGPNMLFADEPTTALDVTVQAQILELLSEQIRDRNMSMLLVTHNLGVVAGYTDEIAVMYGGKVVERAPTKVLFSNVKMPYTEALLQSIPRLNQASHSRLAMIPGRPPDLVNPPTGCRFAPRCAYARDLCTREEPTLVQAESPDHTFACHFPVGSPEYHERRVELSRTSTTTAGAL
jgi:peptide/nickel transport system ATP-binding protein